MNIAIDVRPICSQLSGIGRYTSELVTAIHAEKSEHTFFLYGCRGTRQFTPITNNMDEARLKEVFGLTSGFRVPFPFRKINRVTSEFVAKQRRKPRIDAFLWTDYLGEFSPDYKSLITIHDMSHHYYPQHVFPGHEVDLQESLQIHAIRADLILCMSENTKRDVVNILQVPEEKVWVTYNGVSRVFCVNRDENLLSDLRNRYGLPNRFILFVGTIEPRKNLIKLIEAYHLLYLRDKIREPLVIVGGKGWKNEPLYELIRKLKIEDRIIFPGYVPDSDLPMLYNAATVFVYPSLYEGFGMPVVEAMACGVPVVTSNVSSLPEVAGDAAILVNPEDAEEIASGICNILTDDGIYKNLQERGFRQAGKFTWESCAKKTLEAISFVA